MSEEMAKAIAKTISGIALFAATGDIEKVEQYEEQLAILLTGKVPEHEQTGPASKP